MPERDGALAPKAIRPAGLVEATEGLYRGLFSVAVAFALGAAAWGTVIAPFNGFSDHHMRSVAIGLLATLAGLVAFRERRALYGRLRRRPELLLAIVLASIAVLWLDGGWRSSFYLASYTAIGLSAVVGGLRWSLGCATALAAGYVAGLAINGYSWVELKALHDADSVIANTGGYLLAAFFFATPVGWLGGYVARINQTIEMYGSGDAAAERAPGGLVTRGLSAREIEVVQLIAGGATNEQIATQLVISTRTVHSHVENAMKKTTARNRTDLAVIAVQDGLVPDRTAIAADGAAPDGRLAAAAD